MKQFYRETDLIVHLEQDHGKVIASNSVEFGSYGEFLQWKENDQDKKLVYFAQQRGCIKTY